MKLDRSKAIGIGAVAVVVALAIIGITKLFEGGGGGGGLLPGSGSGISPGAPTKPTGDTTRNLVIRIEGEQYWIDGTARSFDDAVAAAVQSAQQRVDSSESTVLIRKKNARASLVEKLEAEFNRRGIRYRSEDDFR